MKTKKPAGSGKRMTDAAKARMRELRAADPGRWTYCALAARFKCTDGAAFHVVNAARAARPEAARPERNAQEKALDADYRRAAKAKYERERRARVKKAAAQELEAQINAELAADVAAEKAAVA